MNEKIIFQLPHCSLLQRMSEQLWKMLIEAFNLIPHYSSLCMHNDVTHCMHGSSQFPPFAKFHKSLHNLQITIFLKTCGIMLRERSISNKSNGTSSRKTERLVESMSRTVNMKLKIIRSSASNFCVSGVIIKSFSVCPDLNFS